MPTYFSDQADIQNGTGLRLWGSPVDA